MPGTGRDIGKELEETMGKKNMHFQIGKYLSRVRISNHYGAKNGCKQHLHSNYSPGQFTQSDWQDFQLMGKDGIPIPVLRFSYLDGPGSKQIVSNKGLYGCMPFLLGTHWIIKCARLSFCNSCIHQETPLLTNYLVPCPIYV